MPSALRTVLAAALLAAVAGVAPAQTPAPAPLAYAPASARQPVGEVTFAVGPTVKVSAEGLPESVQRGTKILAGDRLDTAEGGLIHVRFVDGALVSLRPGSRLTVEDYRYNPAQVGQSLVRFRLDHGVARAISGAAAEGAKERFRLNTPLVAIGVRGTDFVVRSDAEVTTASVNQGAIVMAPFGVGCVAQALGPCNSPTAKTLSADMGQVLVEFRPQFTQPELKPQQAATALASAKPTTDNARGDTTLVTSTAPAKPSPHTEEEAISANLVRSLVTTAGSSATPATLSTTGTTAAVTVPTQPVEPSQLQWGRWADASGFPGDISLRLEEARTGRTATVGNDQYVLYRASTTANGDLMPGLGSYQFSLQQSQAQYNATGQAAVQATVQGGTLGIDFANRSFSTTLNVNSAPTGTVAVSGGGFVRADGIFVDRSVAGTAIAGSTSLDGKAAGYLFEKATGSGTLSGITLWSRP